MGTRDPSQPLYESLQGEAGQLRALARGLLFDRHGAEDVVQEAWLALLSASRPPREAGAWLSGAVRRLARHRVRDEARRGARERGAAKDERLPAAVETTGRIEILRRLLAAVEALDEPYREVVVLRFLDDLPPREIARRTGLPVNTVRTRARRGIERLRAELDDEHEGSRGELLAALAPLAGPPPLSLLIAPAGSASLGSWTGTVLMTHKLLAAGVAAVLVALGIVGWRGVVDFVDPVVPAAAHEVVAPRAEIAHAPRPADPIASPAGVAAPEGVAREALPESASSAPRPWVVRGLALDPDGRPVADLAVEARCFDGYEADGAPREEIRLATDAEGGFTWPLEVPESAVVVQVIGASARHYVYSSEVPVLAGGEAPSVRLRVYPLDSVALGRTLDEDGAPIEGALVEGLGIEVQTDADGGFRLPTTSHRSSTRLSFSAEGFADTRTYLVPMGPGELVVDDVVLAREARLRGRVLDEAGQPLEDVEVRPGIWGARAVKSDGQGRFEVGTFDPRTELQWLELEKAGFAPLRMGIPTAEFSEELELVLVRGGELVGRVVDSLGNPVEAAEITVGNPPHVLPHQGAWSDPDGRFRVADLEPGSREVWVTHDDFASQSRRVEIPRAAGVAAQVELVVFTGTSVGGVVLDPEDAPVEGVLVYAEGLNRELGVSSTSTDAEGRFVMEGLPDSGFRLGLLEKGFARLEVDDVQAGRLDHVFHLVRSGTIAGRVIDDASGAPVERFRVRLVTPRLLEGEERLWGFASLWVSDGVTFADTDGVFEVAEDDLDAGRVIGVEITAPGYAPAFADHVVTVTDPDPDDVVIRMKPSTRVSGRVIEHASGAPVPDARVRYQRPGSDPYLAAGRFELEFEATTDARGNFELDGLPSGAATLVVEHERFATAVDGPFPVGASGERRIELRAGATLDVRLRDAEGTALGGASIALFRLEPRLPKVYVPDVETDEAGLARFDRLQPGTYQASWQGRHGRASVVLLAANVLVAAEDHVEVELRPSGTAVVEGTLEFPAGFEAPRQLAVNLIPSGDDLTEAERATRLRGTIAEDGRFAFEGVEAGSYAVRALWQIPDTFSHLLGQVSVEVTAGERHDVWLELLAPESHR